MTPATNPPTETEAYRAARAQLCAAELDLVDHQERVAVLRRSLPPGPVLDEYTFVEGPRSLDDGDAPSSVVRLRELFSAKERPLVVYHLMFGKRQTAPCPMCTMWVDGFNGVAQHVGQHADLVVVAAAELGALRAHARDRGWDAVRFVSAASSSFKADLGSEGADGTQRSMLSVLVQDADGSVRQSYSATPRVSETREERGIDGVCATWGLLDLLPGGRNNWYASLSYN